MGIHIKHIGFEPPSVGIFSISHLWVSWRAHTTLRRLIVESLEEKSPNSPIFPSL